MNAEQVIFVAFLSAGTLMICVGVPLWREMVPPNAWLGFRTPATRREERIWYPVNRLAGIWYVVTGVAVASASVFTFLSGFDKDAAAWANLAVTGVFAATMLVHCFVAVARLKRDLSGPPDGAG